MAKTATTPSTEGIRRCIGSRTFGIEPHEAPVSEFPSQPSQKDGLGRMCKPHWKAYTNALRKAALARKAAEAEVAPASESATEPAAEAPAHEHTLAASLVGEGEPIETPTPRRSRRAKATPEQEAVTTAIRGILAE